MNRSLTAAFLLFFGLLVFAPGLFAQQVQAEGARRIVIRANPQYPDIARSMNLGGSVKAEALVEPNGVVKSVEVKGGHPILVRAAENAIYKWKWAPAAHETREAVEVRFAPQ
jgi:TonB family protein